MIQNIVDVGYGSDLYLAGRADDGMPYHAEMYYVYVECKNGERYCHTTVFRGCTVHVDEEGYNHFQDVRETAKADAQRLADRVQAALQAGKTLNMAYWVAIDPCYGSDVYVDQGIELQRVMKERAEG